MILDYRPPKIMLGGFFIVLLLFGCSSEKRDIAVEIECGDGNTVKFEKVLKKQRNYLEGAHSDKYDTLLWYCTDKDNCTLVDQQNKPFPKYASLLYKREHAYERLQTEGKDKEVKSGVIGKYRYKDQQLRDELKRDDKQWNIFISPKMVTKDQFGDIKFAIKNNLERINEVLSRKISGGMKDKFTYNAEPYLNSIVYFDYYDVDIVSRDGYTYKKPSRYVQFTCSNNDFMLFMTPKDSVYLSLVDLIKNGSNRLDHTYLGEVDDTTGGLKLRVPFPKTREKYALESKNEWFSLYSSCYDTSHKSLFDYYRVGFWDYDYDSLKNK